MDKLLYASIYGGCYNDEERATEGFKALWFHLSNHRYLLMPKEREYENYGLRRLLADYPTDPDVPEYIQRLFAELLQELVKSQIVKDDDMCQELFLRFENVWVHHSYMFLPQPDIVQCFADLLKQLLFDETKVDFISKLIRLCSGTNLDDTIQKLRANLVLNKILSSIDLNKRDRASANGETIFMRFVKKNMGVWVYELLMEHGADPFLVDYKGRDILHYCDNPSTEAFFKKLLKERRLHTVLTTRKQHPLHKVPTSIIQKRIAPFLFSARKKLRHRVVYKL